MSLTHLPHFSVRRRCRCASGAHCERDQHSGTAYHIELLDGAEVGVEWFIAVPNSRLPRFATLAFRHKFALTRRSIAYTDSVPRWTRHRIRCNPSTTDRRAALRSRMSLEVRRKACTVALQVSFWAARSAKAGRQSVGVGGGVQWAQRMLIRSFLSHKTCRRLANP